MPSPRIPAVRRLTKLFSQHWLLTTLVWFVPIALLTAWVVKKYLEPKWLEPVLKDFDILKVIEHVATGAYGYVLVRFLIENPFDRHYRKIRSLDFPAFIQRMGSANRYIYILDIWMYRLLLTGNNKHFREAILKALRAGCVRIKILIADPDSSVARERAAALAGTPGFADQNANDILQAMTKCIAILRDIQGEASAKLTRYKKARPDFLEIRLFRDKAEFSMHKIDEMAYWSRYPKNQLSSSGGQYVTYDEIGPTEYQLERFYDLWEDHTTVPLEDIKPTENASA